jgi:exodeoxyribonuclease VII small subunit
MATENQKIDFEQSLNDLNTIVEKLEKGGVSLEDSLKLFEQGIMLTRTCQQALQQAEQKVQILLQKEGKEKLTDFNSEENA